MATKNDCVLPSSYPCAQEKTIDSIHDTLERMEKTQEKLVDLLTTVAVQNKQLDHIESRQEEHDNILHELGNRMRDQELLSASDPGSRLRWDTQIKDMHDKIDEISPCINKILNFHKILFSREAKFIYFFFGFLILFNTWSTLVNHVDFVKNLWELYKG